jgi:hypothetical protein
MFEDVLNAVMLYALWYAANTSSARVIQKKSGKNPKMPPQCTIKRANQWFQRHSNQLASLVYPLHIY